jgi:uncharacterized protein YcbX
VNVGADIIKMGAGSPPGTFFDFAPLHVVTTATLDGITEARDGLPIEPERYRPNVVVFPPSGTSAFPENHWVNGILSIGNSVTPPHRVAHPALRHPHSGARRPAGPQWRANRNGAAEQGRHPGLRDPALRWSLRQGHH